MHVWVYIWMHVCMNAFSCDWRVSSHVTVNIFDMPRTTDCHIASMSNTIISPNGYRPNILACTSKNTTNCNIYFTCYCHVCAINKYAPKMPLIYHIWKLIHVKTWETYVNTCVSHILAANNSDQEHQQWHRGWQHWCHSPIALGELAIDQK